MSILKAPRGSQVIIRTVNLGPETAQRLCEMGVLPGKTVKILRNEGHCPMILQVGTSSLMLGRNMCNKISVSAENQ